MGLWKPFPKLKEPRFYRGRIHRQQRKSLKNVMLQVVTSRAKETGTLKCWFDVKYCTHTRAHKYLTALIVYCSFFCLFLPGNTFAGVTAYVLPAGIGNARHQIFQRQIKQNGGQTENALSPGITHIVVDDNMDVDRAVRLMKVPCVPPGVHLVKCTWLSLCISEKKLLDVGRYSLLSPMGSVT